MRADLPDIQLISKYYEGFLFLLYAINIFSIYAWVVWLKGKKSITITNPFQKLLDESNCKAKLVNFTIDQWNHGSR